MTRDDVSRFLAGLEARIASADANAARHPDADQRRDARVRADAYRVALDEARRALVSAPRDGALEQKKRLARAALDRAHERRRAETAGMTAEQIDAYDAAIDRDIEEAVRDVRHARALDGPHGDTLRAYEAMSLDERFALDVKVGIYTPDGKLTPEYGGDAPDTLAPVSTEVEAAAYEVFDELAAACEATGARAYDVVGALAKTERERS